MELFIIQEGKDKIKFQNGINIKLPEINKEKYNIWLQLLIK